jgi:type II secretory pathway pseudopilin PulG
MAEQKSAEKPTPQRKVLQTLVILLVIIIAGFVAFRLILKSRLNARLDAIRVDGYPATCAELDAWYTIPESAENAADTFIDSFSYYEKWEGEEKRKLLPIAGQAELPLRTEPLAEETKALITEYLADNQQALELLHKGAAIEHSRYPVDFSKGFEILLPDLSNIRVGAFLLKLEAVLHAENGKSEKVAGSIKSTFGLAHSLSKEPILISQLVRIACQALAVLTLEHVINRTEFTDEQLVDLSRTLANAEGHFTLSRAFAGERCMGVSIFKMPAAQIPRLVDGSSSPLGVLRIALCKFAGLADMDAIIYIDLMNDYIESIQLPLHQREEAANAVDTKFDETSRIHVLLRAIMPALSRCTTIDLRTAAQLRTARAGLAIQRYRLATDGLPNTLSELTPTYLDEVPKDPFDGKDLRYKKLETGFVVYSIGKDGNDDGGKERPRERTSRPAPEDVTFIVQR